MLGDLDAILTYADFPIDGYQSISALAQWFDAYNYIASESDGNLLAPYTYPEPVILNAFKFQEVGFGGGDSLSNFSELINFFQGGQLTAEQVQTIIRGFTWNTDNPENLILAFDANDDQAVGSQDLLAFLVSYGQPGFDGGTAETVIANLLGFNGAGLGNFPD